MFIAASVVAARVAADNHRAPIVVASNSQRTSRGVMFDDDDLVEIAAGLHLQNVPQRQQQQRASVEAPRKFAPMNQVVWITCEFLSSFLCYSRVLSASRFALAPHFADSVSGLGLRLAEEYLKKKWCVVLHGWDVDAPLHEVRKRASEQMRSALSLFAI